MLGLLLCASAALAAAASGVDGAPLARARSAAADGASRAPPRCMLPCRFVAPRAAALLATAAVAHISVVVVP